MTKMIKREFYPAMDECYDEYLVTKCPLHPNIFVGSLDCSKCDKFIKLHEKFNDEDRTDYVICRK